MYIYDKLDHTNIIITAFITRVTVLRSEKFIRPVSVLNWTCTELPTWTELGKMKQVQDCTTVVIEIYEDFK